MAFFYEENMRALAIEAEQLGRLELGQPHSAESPY
jgi:hypothetical protein